MAIVPTNRIFFNGNYNNDVFFKGNYHKEAWMCVDGQLECIWKKASALQDLILRTHYLYKAANGIIRSNTPPSSYFEKLDVSTVSGVDANLYLVETESPDSYTRYKYVYVADSNYRLVVNPYQPGFLNSAVAIGVTTNSLTSVLDFSGVEDATNIFSNTANVTGTIIQLPKASDLDSAYYNCGFSGSPYIGENVVSVEHSFSYTPNLTGAPVSPTNSQCRYMTNTYYYSGVSGKGACGDQIQYMQNTYCRCQNITEAYVGPNVFNMTGAYQLCNNIASAYVGANVVIMNMAYYGCANLIEPAMADNVEYMSSAYGNCFRLQTALIGNNVTTASSSYRNCTNLTTAVCGPNVRVFSYCYDSCTNLRLATCSDSVEYMVSTYGGCKNLIGPPVFGANVTYASSAYAECVNMLGSPIIPPKAIDIGYTYSNCRKLTGNPASSDTVINMYGTYTNCINLTGSPVCGSKVNDMSYTYANCTNLTGAPVSGPAVLKMIGTYNNCRKLTGSIKVGENVRTMVNCFRNTTNLNCVYLPNASYSFTNATMVNAFSGFGSALSSRHIICANYNTMNLITHNGYIAGTSPYSWSKYDCTEVEFDGVMLPVNVAYKQNNLYVYSLN